MFITCGISQNVSYIDEKNTMQLCTLRPGRHNYPMLNPKDPVLAETLRVLRKIGKITFDDLLPGDSEILKSAPKGVDPKDYLASKVLAKPSPVGRKVNKKPEEQIKKEAKTAKEKGNARRADRKDTAPSGKAAKGGDLGQKSGGVSEKK